MTARHQGRIFSDRVTILDPTATKPFYRLTYLDSDGHRRERTGGTSPTTALARAAALDYELTVADQTASRPVTIGTLVDEYLATPRRRHRDKQGYPTGKDWTENHYAQVTRDLRRAVVGVEDLPVAKLDLDTVDRMRTSCGSDPMVRQMTTCVRTFLRWAHEQGALTDGQVALLPSTHARPARPRFLQEQPRPARVRITRIQGQSEAFVNDEDCPAPGDLFTLAAALGSRIRAGELAVHLASGCGLRAGERFQLTADDVLEVGDGARLDVMVRAQWATNPTRRTAPKTGAAPRSGSVPESRKLRARNRSVSGRAASGPALAPATSSSRPDGSHHVDAIADASTRRRGRISTTATAPNRSPSDCSRLAGQSAVRQAMRRHSRSCGSRPTRSAMTAPMCGMRTRASSSESSTRQSWPDPFDQALTDGSSNTSRTSRSSDP